MLEEQEEEEGKASGLGTHLNKNAAFKSPQQPAKHKISSHTGVPHTAVAERPHSPPSLENNCSEVVWLNSFLTTLSLIERSAAGLGVSARSRRSDYNQTLLFGCCVCGRFGCNLGFLFLHPFVTNPGSFGDTVL